MPLDLQDFETIARVELASRRDPKHPGKTFRETFTAEVVLKLVRTAQDALLEATD